MSSTFLVISWSFRWSFKRKFCSEMAEEELIEFVCKGINMVCFFPIFFVCDLPNYNFQIWGHDPSIKKFLSHSMHKEFIGKCLFTIGQVYSLLGRSDWPLLFRGIAQIIKNIVWIIIKLSVITYLPHFSQIWKMLPFETDMKIPKYQIREYRGIDKFETIKCKRPYQIHE